MANNGKLVFPVKFDLHSAVNQASGDIDAVLRRMQTQINSHPLIIKTKIDGKDWTNEGIFKSNTEVGRMMFKSVNMLAKDGSIETIRKEMSALVLEWEKLSEKERTATDAQGRLSGRAKEIVTRYAELTAVINSNAKALQQLVTESDKAVKAEEKRVALANKLYSLKNPNQDSVLQIKNSLAYYEKLAASATQWSKGWEYCTAKVRELKSRLDELNATYAAMTRKQVDAMPEKTFEQIESKLRAMREQMRKCVPDSAAYRNAEAEVRRLSVQYDSLKRSIDAAYNAGKRMTDNERRQLQTEWNAAADKHKADEAEKERQILNETLRIKKEAEQAAQREADIIKTANEYKLKQLQAEQEKKRRSDEDYQNLVNQLKEENRLAIEKAKSAKAEREKAEAAAKAAEALARQQAKQERYENLRRQVAILQGEENTIDQINAKLRIRNEWLNKSTKGSDQFRNNAEEVARLNKLLDEMKAKQLEAMRGQISAMPDKSLADIQKKIQAYRNVMQNATFGSKEFKDAESAAGKLTTKLEKMNKEVAKQEQWRTFQQALIQSSKTFEGLNAKINAWTAQMQSMKFGTAEWNAAAATVAKYHHELAVANQYLADFQQRAFKGLGQQLTTTQVTQLQQYRTELTRLETEYNKLNAAGQAFNSNGTLTNAAIANAQQRASVLEKVANITRDVTQADEAYKKKLADEEKELQRLIALEEKRAKRLREHAAALNANEQRMAGLNAKLQVYQQLIQKQQIGTDAWTKSAREIARLNAELEKTNQRLADIQNKAFRGVDSGDMDTQLQRLKWLRNEVEMYDKSIQRLYQNLNANSSSMSPSSKQLIQDNINSQLKSRAKLQKEIADITKTAAQLQAEREKEINRIIEQRKAKADAIAAKRKAEQAAIQSNINKQKEERRILNQKESSINAINAKLEVMNRRLNSSNFKSGDFEKIAKEVERLTRKLDEARRKVAELTGQSTSGASKQAANARKVNEEYARQTTYLERLLRRMMVYASVGAIGQFLTKVRETTAQFELQRISLGAIIQDQNRANQLFSEIKNFALKSPLSIMDLTKYTKQLAAYKIGWNGVRTDTEELFDTTKRLADVAVGLGVDFQRIVLMYGQIRATGYLRASEVRQATEAGIPLVEELAAKLSKLNGEQVTAAQVMDMISKRAISFDMVKEVFDDMTSAGGIFYNMQEKQGNTLYGLWQKLGDAASLMYAEIGNTGWVNDAMKGFANTLMGLMRHWGSFSRMMIVLAGGFALYKIQQNLATVSTVAASKATRDYARAQLQLNVAKSSGNTLSARAAQYTMRAAAANRAAAMSTSVLTSAYYRCVGAVNSLKAALVGNVWTIVITAFAAIAMAIYNAYTEAHKLDNEVTKLKDETGVLQAQSVRDFERLADSAVKAADGSRKQKDALDELNRTYGDILPAEALKIENLRKMKGGYDELTQTIRENIAAQQAEKMENAIKESYEREIVDTQKIVRVMLKKGYDMSDDEIDRFWVVFQDRAAKAGKVTMDMVREINAELHLGLSEDDMTRMSRESRWGNKNWLQEIAKKYKEMEDSLKNVSEWEATAAKNLGQYTTAMQAYEKAVESKMNSGETLQQQQENVNTQIRYMGSSIQSALQQVGIQWQSGWAEIVKSVDPDNLAKVSTLNMDAILAAIDPNKYPQLYKYVKEFKNIYDGLIPPDPTVQQIRGKFFSIAQGIGSAQSLFRQYLWNGQTALTDHIKSLKENIDKYNAEIYRMQQSIAKGGMLGKLAQLVFGGEIEKLQNLVEGMTQIMKFEQTYVAPSTENSSKKSGGSTRQDTRLQNLQEIAQTLAKINKEYDDLTKSEGKTASLKDVKKQFQDTLDYTNKLSKKFGLHFDFPTEFKSLQQYRREILKVMETLKNLKGGEKAILDFKTMIEKADSDAMQKALEAKLKELQEKISQTKTAREFFDKILSQTGDVELATRVSLSLYGDTGKELFKNTVEQIRQIFKSGDTDKDLEIEWELNNAIDIKNERINYNELAKIYEEYQDDIIEKNRETAKKIIEEGRKTVAANILNWEKEFAKAKKFEERKLELIRQAKAERDKIIHEVSDPVERDRLLKGSVEKQNRDMSQLNFEEFKNSEYYIDIFEDLGTKTTASLKQLRAEMQAIIDTDKNLSPENMKTLVKAMDDIDNEINGRGFGNTMVQSVKNYFQAVKDLKLARQELAAAQAEYDAQEPALNAAIDLARIEQDAAQQELNRLKSDELATDEQIVAAQLRLNQATENVQRAEQKKATAKKKVANIEKKITKEQDNQKKATVDLFGDLNKCGQAARNLAGMLGDVKDLLQVSDESAAGIVFDSAIQGLEAMATAIEIVTTAQAIFNAVSESNPWIAAAALILAVASALMMGIQNQKVAKANKEIERQQKLIDQLEYSLKKLEKAADKAFGGDFVRNIQQQLETLSAEYEAKQKQLEAEKSKGKKKDKNKVDQYTEDMRDINDQIDELKDKLTEQVLGTDLGSAARDFAQAWLDAYKEFGDTTDAIKGKFKDMIENMIVESVLGEVMEKALKPVYEMIQNMGDEDFNDINFWKRVVDVTGKATTNAVNGAEIVSGLWEQAGINLRELGSDMSGISRDIAGASEESINGLAAGINTQNFYIAQINANVAVIAQKYMSGTATEANATPAIDITALTNQAMSHLQGINQHTAETVAECRRIADSCEQSYKRLSQLIVIRGNGAFINTKMIN